MDIRNTITSSRKFSRKLKRQPSSILHRFFLKLLLTNWLAGLAVIAGTMVASAQSGMVGKAEKLPDITMSSDAPLADKPLELKAGQYYDKVVEMMSR